MESETAPLFDSASDIPSIKIAYSRFDYTVLVIILLFGLGAIIFHPRTPDFLGEDVFYADAAQSILHQGTYAVNGVRETTQPPGLSLILACLFAIFGYGYGIATAAIATFQTLGFMFAYVLLRRRVGQLVAAGVCIILISSPLCFAWATRMVYACFPYFFTTMAALLLSENYEKSQKKYYTLLWGSLFSLSVVASLLIATSTAALLGAIVMTILVAGPQDPSAFRRRLRRFVPVLAGGLVVLAFWLHQKPAQTVWSLPGYPASYFQQLKVKNGNYPELGYAKLRDIPSRVLTNLVDEANVLGTLVVRHGVNTTKYAVVLIPVLLMILGWIYAVWCTKGMDLADWYFAGYQFIYLLWPWHVEDRFVIPIAPFACMYIWKGGEALAVSIRRRPRVVALVWFPVALLLGASGMHWVYSHRITGYGDLPDELLVPLWLISAFYAFWTIYTGKSLSAAPAIPPVIRWTRHLAAQLRGDARTLVRSAVLLVAAGLVGIGLATEVRIASENVRTKGLGSNFEISGGTGDILVSEVKAGMWLRSHTSEKSVVMARHWPTVHHFAQRRSVWFAPISDPDVLMEGIRRLGVNYVVVIHHSNPYYLPDDHDCFDKLLTKYSDGFEPVFREGELQIFRIK